MEILKKIFKSFLIGAITGILVSIMTSKFVPDLIDRLEHQTYYMRYYWKYWDMGSTPGETLNKSDDSTGICIVDIDDRSMHKLGSYWNWNRSYHAKMINALNENFPAAIAFDINFYDPEDEHEKKKVKNLIEYSKEKYGSISIPGENKFDSILVNSIDYDEQFISATKKAGVVYHGIRLSDESDYPEIDKSQIMQRATMIWYNSLKPSSAITIPEEQRQYINNSKTIIDGIFPPLAQASQDIGHLNMTPNSDGVIREVELLYGFGKNKPVFLPISMRIAVTLFATPDSEIVFVPGKSIDIGSPFKIMKDKRGRITCSYPNVTLKQVMEIIKARDKINSLKENVELPITSFTAVSKDKNGGRLISMYCGEFPSEITDAFLNFDMKKLKTQKVGTTINLTKEIASNRDDESDWIITAPYGDEEYYISSMDVKMLSLIDSSDFTELKAGEKKLLFHSFDVKNRGRSLTSSIPVLRDRTLKQLISADINDIKTIKPGSRIDFGKHVVIPLTPDNKHIITYFGKQKQPFVYYSYYDIMKKRVHGHLDGKIYLVGSTVPAMFDIVNTSVSNDYPGVEVHASLLNSFITNTFIRRLKPWEDFLILLTVAIVIGFLAYMSTPVIGAILSAAMIFGYFLLAMTLFGGDNIWIEIVRPIATIIFTYTAVMAYRYITEEKGRKFLQNTFKTYLSPELIDTMYKEKQMPKLGGDEGIRTAFFTDIQSFSTFSEKLGSPTRLVELLNEYLTEMTDSLLEHYGTLDKYEGDAIIAFFGAPMPIDDHAQQACLTALDMQYRLDELRRKWIAEGEKWPVIVHNMRMRIGINTGAITTGNMGSAVRMNYTMMGDAVNLAARLESAAKQYGIYTMISDATYKIVKDEFEVRQVDKITVVGKSEPVIVYELLSKKGELNEEIVKLVDMYNDGLKLFYDREWDKAIDILTESEKMEPYRSVAPGGMSPSRKIKTYCEMFKENPPEENWDGVIKLTSK